MRSTARSYAYDKDMRAHLTHQIEVLEAAEITTVAAEVAGGEQVIGVEDKAQAGHVWESGKGASMMAPPTPELPSSKGEKNLPAVATKPL